MFQCGESFLYGSPFVAHSSCGKRHPSNLMRVSGIMVSSPISPAWSELTNLTSPSPLLWVSTEVGGMPILWWDRTLRWANGTSHQGSSGNLDKVWIPGLFPLCPIWISNIGQCRGFKRVSLVAQSVENLQETWPGFDPWVGKIPWRRECLPTAGCLPGEFHGQRSLVG